MIDHAYRRQVRTDSHGRVSIAGFSAAAMFANRFAVLHPRRVRAVAAGSPGGWPIVPDPSPLLTYPAGTSDTSRWTGRPVDLRALQWVRFFFFRGEQDHSGALGFRDSFSAEQESFVRARFGETLEERWRNAERAYHRAGLSATFRVYPGVGHEWTTAMDDDVGAELERAAASALSDFEEIRPTSDGSIR